WRRALIGDEFHRRPAQLHIGEIERQGPGRRLDLVPRPDLEAQHLGIEFDRLLRLVGDDLDVVDALEHSLPSGCVSRTDYSARGAIASLLRSTRRQGRARLP